MFPSLVTPIPEHLRPRQGRHLEAHGRRSRRKRWVINGQHAPVDISCLEAMSWGLFASRNPGWVSMPGACFLRATTTSLPNGGIRIHPM